MRYSLIASFVRFQSLRKEVIFQFSSNNFDLFSEDSQG